MVPMTATTRRRVQMVIAALWVALGVWSLADGRGWLGVAQCLVGVAWLAYALVRRPDPADSAPRDLDHQGAG